MDAGVEGVPDESLAGVTTKQEPEKEETDAFIEEPEAKPEIESTDQSNNFRIRVLSGSVELVFPTFLTPFIGMELVWVCRT